jgi:hypothetical protein
MNATQSWKPLILFENRLRSRRDLVTIAQGDPEQAEGAALGTRYLFGLAPQRGDATSMHSTKTDSWDFPDIPGFQPIRSSRRT